jgi:hypothetical protein
MGGNNWRLEIEDLRLKIEKDPPDGGMKHFDPERGRMLVARGFIPLDSDHRTNNNWRLEIEDLRLKIEKIRLTAE